MAQGSILHQHQCTQVTHSAGIHTLSASVQHWCSISAHKSHSAGIHTSSALVQHWCTHKSHTAMGSTLPQHRQSYKAFLAALLTAI
eukprot:scaffold121625_cov17-Tisochrysis_lutea.AAC.1